MGWSLVSAGMLLVALSTLALCLIPASASAALVFFSDRTSWEAALTGETTIDFEGLAPDADFVFRPTPPGITLAGANFTIDHTNNDGVLFAIGDGFYYDANSVLSSQQSAIGPNNILITLPSGVDSIAVDLGSFFANDVAVVLSTGETFTAESGDINQPPEFVFLGFTSSIELASLRLEIPTVDVPNIVLNIDNFAFGALATTAVPSPPAITLIGLGILVALGVRPFLRPHDSRELLRSVARTNQFPGQASSSRSSSAGASRSGETAPGGE